MVYTVRRHNNEVAFIDHNEVYFKYFDSQRRFCDEISGLKMKQVVNPDEQERFLITRLNFEWAIKRLNSFSAGTGQYFMNPRDHIEISSQINELELEFINDETYHRFVRLSDSLNNSQNMNFNILYMNYLFKCYAIFEKINKKCQISIKTMAQPLYIDYTRTEGFIKNLVNYMEEVSNNLSDFKFQDIIEHTKKIAGYYYTYSYLIKISDKIIIEKSMNDLKEFICEREVIDLIVKIQDKNINYSDEEQIRTETNILKRLFNVVFFVVNRNLSNKRVLPKVQEPKLIDRTLI